MLPLRHILMPTPYAVGPVNVYLILSRPYTLIDSGPETGQAKEILRKHIEKTGISLTDIKRIILTHSHSDHSGLAYWINEISRAEIFIHPLELLRLIKPQNFLEVRLDFILETGIPKDSLEQMFKTRDKLPYPRIPDGSVIELKGGEELAFEDGVLKIYHLPGHSPGHLCLYDPDGGNFFSGDFLLPGITPNPLVEYDPDQPGKRLHTLSMYLDGLNKVDRMDIKTVWPGHGGKILNHRQLIASYREHHENRVNNILELLHNKGEMNAYEISSLMYPKLQGFEIFLGLSEIQAHLDILGERGLIRVREEEKVLYYRAAD